MTALHLRENFFSHTILVQISKWWTRKIYSLLCLHKSNSPIRCPIYSSVILKQPKSNLEQKERKWKIPNYSHFWMKWKFVFPNFLLLYQVKIPHCKCSTLMPESARLSSCYFFMWIMVRFAASLFPIKVEEFVMVYHHFVNVSCFFLCILLNYLPVALLYTTLMLPNI